MRSGTLDISDSDEAVTFTATISQEMQEVSYVKDVLAAVAAGLAIGISPGFRLPPKRAVPEPEKIEDEGHDPENGAHNAIIRTVMAALLYEMEYRNPSSVPRNPNRVAELVATSTGAGVPSVAPFKHEVAVMVDLIEQIEAITASYPAVPSGLSTAAAALDTDAIWARIEAYTAHRFTDRQVVWVIEGQAGECWKPPLTPVTSHTAERWDDSARASVTILDGPVGLYLPSNGTFRVTAQVGAGDVPAPVSEAFRRLAEYSVELGKDSMVTGHPAIRIIQWT